ncbi:hypothetical protein Tco_0542623 [Tanacetum coccineum]
MLLQDNLALGERLDKHGTRLYNLENLDIPHKVSQAIDEIVTDAVDWAMQVPLRARFRDLPTIDMKEILHQRMFEYESYKANNVYKDLYEALQKSLELDYLNHPPPPAGAFGAPGTSGASGSSQLPPPPPPPSTGAQKLSPSDDLMHDDFIPDEQVHVSNDQNSRDDHTPAAADSRKDWWKPLPEEERPATPKPDRTILPSNVSDTGDMTNLLNWYCRQINKSKLTQVDLEGQAYEVVKVFYPDIIHLQFQMEECHKMLTDQVDWANPEGDQVRINVNRPLPLGGPPGYVTIQIEFFFNKDLEYMRFGNKGSMPVFSISKMKAARYPDFGLELLVPEQMWIEDVCTYDISAKYGIAHWVYYMEGLGHNLFSVGQFCDYDLSVAFMKHTCYVRDTNGVELIKGSRGSNLYTISVEDMMKSSPICLLSKPSKKDQSKKRKLVKETSDAPSPAKRSKVGKVTKQRKPKKKALAVGLMSLLMMVFQNWKLVYGVKRSGHSTCHETYDLWNKAEEVSSEINAGTQDEGQSGTIPRSPILSPRVIAVHEGPKLENTWTFEVSQAVDEIVTDAVDWAMQVPLRARFRDLPTVDMKEILQQRMFEDDSFKTLIMFTRDLYEAAEVLGVRYSIKRLAVSGRAISSTPPQQATSSTSWVVKFRGHPRLQASANNLMAYASLILRYESTGLRSGPQELSPSDDLMHDDSVPDDKYRYLSDSRLRGSIDGDMDDFLNWYCRQINKSKLTQADLEGQAYEVVKVANACIVNLQDEDDGGALSLTFGLELASARKQRWICEDAKHAIDVEPIVPRNRNNREVHLDYLRHLKESVETLREIVEEAKIERPLDRVYYVEGLGHNLFSVRQFCNSDLEVAFRKHTCYVRDTDGVELIKGSRGSNLYIISETSDAPSPTKRSKAGKVTKQRKPKIPLQLVDEFVDEGVPEQEPVYGDEEAGIQRAVELSIKEQAEHTQGPARPMVIREPDFGRIQPLPDTPKKKSPAEQYIFQRRTPTTTEPSGHAESPSLYAELGLTNSETESDEEVSPEINVGTQDEGQAGPNPGIQDEGKAGSNPGDAAESQPQSSHVVHAGPNLKHMDFEVTNASTQQNPEQMDEEFTTMAYPSVQENLKLPTKDQVRLEEPASSARTLSSLQNLDKELSFTNQFLMEKSQEEKPDKSNTKAEVQSMVTVLIHQDTSLVPLMTTPVIDLTMSKPVSTTVQAPLPTSTATVTAITITTSLPPPPPQP